MTTLRRDRRPTPPGEILNELFLKPRGVSQTAFAEAVGITRKHLNRIIHNHTRLEPEVAARFGKVLGTSTALWINLQAAIDTYDADQAVKRWKPMTVYKAA